MAERIKDTMNKWFGDVRAELWKIGTIPYNTTVIFAATAVMIQSRAWKIRSA